MGDVAALYNALSEEIGKLQNRYVSQYIPADPQHTPEDFEYDVKAFCVLTHAACEDFVEQISEEMMLRIESDFVMKKIVTQSTVTMLMYHSEVINADEEDSVNHSCFDRIRKSLKSAKSKHSDLLRNNHGFSMKYLKKLLIPVGINPPSGTILESLRLLTDARGSFAHTRARHAMFGEYKKATRILTPEEAVSAAKDCVEICKQILERALLILNPGNTTADEKPIQAEMQD